MQRNGWSYRSAFRLLAISIAVCAFACASCGSGETSPAPIVKWSPTNLIADEVISASCMLSQTCMGIDLQGRYLTFTNGSWSKPTIANVGPGNSLVSGFLDCPSVTQCLALAHTPTGLALVSWNGTTWTSHPNPTGEENVASFACTAVDLCFALTEDDHVLSYNNSQWTRSRIQGIDSSSRISCTQQFCIAIDSKGSAVVYRKNRWTPPTELALRGFTMVSCVPAEPFCMAMDPENSYVTFNGSTWSRVMRANSPEAVTSLACIALRECVAFSRGFALDYRASTWSAPIRVSNAVFVHLECPSSSFCLAVALPASKTPFSLGRA